MRRLGHGPRLLQLVPDRRDDPGARRRARPDRRDRRLRGRDRRLRRGVGERRAAARARPHRRPGRQRLQRAQPRRARRATRGPATGSTIAVFGINGPISASPRNYIWMRTATLDFYATARSAGRPTRGRGALDAGARAGGRRLRVHRGPRVVARTARCCSARRTRTRSTAWTPRTVASTRLPHQERLHRRRHRPLPPAGLQRAGVLDPHGPADDLPARQPPRDPRRTRTATRPCSPTATRARLNSPNDLVYRSDGDAVLHRSAVRAARRFDDAAKSCRSAASTASRDGEVPLVTRRARGPERHRALARRALPLRRQLGSGRRKVVMRYDRRTPTVARRRGASST